LCVHGLSRTQTNPASKPTHGPQLRRSLLNAFVQIWPQPQTLQQSNGVIQDDLPETMLPEPALTLTIPSLHDSTVLDCRIYHPASLTANPRAPPWRRHAAILSHPYAPLGGCFDDPVLDEVGEQLLRKGYLLGTFNFRCVKRVAEEGEL
jgi:hypothetical protein